MKRRRIRTFLQLVLTYFSTLIPNGNAKFGDYLKNSLNKTNQIVNLNTTNTSQQNDHFDTNLQYQKPSQTRRENFEVREVRIYATNPSPMYQNRERKMLESLFPDNALQPGQDFDLRKQIYGPDLKQELDSLLEHTSPSWDQLQALLKKANRVTRLPQSMYDDYLEGVRKSPGIEFKNLQSDSDKFNAGKNNSSKREDLSVGTMFKRYLQTSVDVSMDFGRGRQIYPFAGDFSLSDAVIRNKREIPVHRYNNFSRFMSDGTGRAINYQSFGPTRQSYFNRPPPASQFFRTTSQFAYNSFTPDYYSRKENHFPRFPPDRNAVGSNHQSNLQSQQPYYFRDAIPTSQFPRMTKFTYNSFNPINSYSGKVNEARRFYTRSSFQQNFNSNNPNQIYFKITSKITKLTPHGTFDATWRELMQQINPIQQKIIQDLFLHGPPTTSDHNSQTSLSNLKMDGKQINNSLIYTSSLPSQNTSTSFSTSKFRIREVDRRSTTGVQSTLKKLFTYDQVWITKSTSPTYISPKIRHTVTIDSNLMKEWLKSLNPQDREEMENLFFNAQSSSPYDIRDAESIKNAIKNEFLQGTRKSFGAGFTPTSNNLKSTFISRNDNNKRRLAEDTGVRYYDYEDLSRLLRQAPQDKLKIVDDWCEEIERDLHRRFPTAITKYGDTRNPGPFPTTRYYPWELFSMLPYRN